MIAAWGWAIPVLLTVDEIWSPQATDVQPGVEGEQASSVPSFVITVKGTTPYRDGPQLISQNFISWLQTNTQRDDRPYEIVVTKKALKRIEKITLEEAQEINRSRQTVGRGAPQSRNRGRGTAGVQRGRRTTRSRSSDGRDYDLDELLPQRPMEGKAQSGDWSFEIEWIINLVRPEHSRRTEGDTRQGAFVWPAHDRQSISSTVTSIGGRRQ